MKILKGLKQFAVEERRGSIPSIYLPVKSFVALRASLQDARVQKYLAGDAFRDLPKDEKLLALSNEILHLGLPLGNEELFQIYTGLPRKSATSVSQETVRYMPVNINVVKDVRAAIATPAIQDFLESENPSFRKLPREEKLVALVRRIKALGLTLRSQNLANIHLALPRVLSEHVRREDIYKVALPMRIYDQVETAIDHPQIQAYLESDEFRNMDAEDQSAELVRKIKKRDDLSLDSESLAEIYTALPVQLSPSVFKENIRRVALSLTDYDQLRNALNDEEVQRYLVSGEFRALNKHDRLASLVQTIRERPGVPLKPKNLEDIYTGLPKKLPGTNVTKAEFHGQKNYRSAKLRASGSGSLEWFDYGFQDPIVEGFMQFMAFAFLPLVLSNSGIGFPMTAIFSLSAIAVVQSRLINLPGHRKYKGQYIDGTSIPADKAVAELLWAFGVLTVAAFLGGHYVLHLHQTAVLGLSLLAAIVPHMLYNNVTRLRTTAGDMLFAAGAWGKPRERRRADKIRRISEAIGRMLAQEPRPIITTGTITKEARISKTALYDLMAANADLRRIVDDATGRVSKFRKNRVPSDVMVGRREKVGEYKRDEKIKRVLEAINRLLAKEPRPTITTESIAAEAGISKTTLYDLMEENADLKKIVDDVTGRVSNFGEKKIPSEVKIWRAIEDLLILYPGRVPSYDKIVELARVSRGSVSEFKKKYPTFITDKMAEMRQSPQSQKETNNVDADHQYDSRDREGQPLRASGSGSEERTDYGLQDPVMEGFMQFMVFAFLPLALSKSDIEFPLIAILTLSAIVVVQMQIFNLPGHRKYDGQTVRLRRIDVPAKMMLAVLLFGFGILTIATVIAGHFMFQGSDTIVLAAGLAAAVLPHMLYNNYTRLRTSSGDLLRAAGNLGTRSEEEITAHPPNQPDAATGLSDWRAGGQRLPKEDLIAAIIRTYKELHEGEERRLGEISSLANRDSATLSKLFPNPDETILGKRMSIKAKLHLDSLWLTIRRREDAIELVFHYEKDNGIEISTWRWETDHWESQDPKSLFYKELEDVYKTLLEGEERYFPDASAVMDMKHGTVDISFPNPDGTDIGRNFHILSGRVVESISLTVRRINGKIELVFDFRTSANKGASVWRWEDDHWESQDPQYLFYKALKIAYADLTDGEQRHFRDASPVISLKRGEYYQSLPSPDGGTLGRAVYIREGMEAASLTVRMREGKIELVMYYKKCGEIKMMVWRWQQDHWENVGTMGLSSDEVRAAFNELLKKTEPTSDEKIIQAIEEWAATGKDFTVQAIAKLAGLSRQTVYNRIQNSLKIKEAIKAAKVPAINPIDKKIVDAIERLSARRMGQILTHELIAQEAKLDAATLLERIELNAEIKKAVLSAIEMSSIDKKIFDALQRLSSRGTTNGMTFESIAREAELDAAVVLDRSKASWAIGNAINIAIERSSKDKRIFDAIERLLAKIPKPVITQEVIAREAQVNEATVSKRKGANPELRKAIINAVSSNRAKSDRVRSTDRRPAQQKILEAIERLLKQLRPLTNKAIIAEASISNTTFYNSFENDPAVRERVMTARQQLPQYAAAGSSDFRSRLATILERDGLQDFTNLHPLFTPQIVDVLEQNPYLRPVFMVSLTEKEGDVGPLEEIDRDAIRKLGRAALESDGRTGDAVHAVAQYAAGRELLNRYTGFLAGTPEVANRLAADPHVRIFVAFTDRSSAESFNFRVANGRRAYFKVGDLWLSVKGAGQNVEPEKAPWSVYRAENANRYEGLVSKEEVDNTLYGIKILHGSRGAFADSLAARSLKVLVDGEGQRKAVGKIAALDETAGRFEPFVIFELISPYRLNKLPQMLDLDPQYNEWFARFREYQRQYGAPAPRNLAEMLGMLTERIAVTQAEKQNRQLFKSSALTLQDFDEYGVESDNVEFESPDETIKAARTNSVAPYVMELLEGKRLGVHFSLSYLFALHVEFFPKLDSLFRRHPDLGLPLLDEPAAEKYQKLLEKGSSLQAPEDFSLYLLQTFYRSYFSHLSDEMLNVFVTEMPSGGEISKPIKFLVEKTNLGKLMMSRKERYSALGIYDEPNGYVARLIQNELDRELSRRDLEKTRMGNGSTLRWRSNGRSEGQSTVLAALTMPMLLGGLVIAAKWFGIDPTNFAASAAMMGNIFNAGIGISASAIILGSLAIIGATLVCFQNQLGRFASVENYRAANVSQRVASPDVQLQNLQNAKASGFDTARLIDQLIAGRPLSMDDAQQSLVDLNRLTQASNRAELNTFAKKFVAVSRKRWSFNDAREILTNFVFAQRPYFTTVAIGARDTKVEDKIREAIDGQARGENGFAGQLRFVAETPEIRQKIISIVTNAEPGVQAKIMVDPATPSLFIDGQFRISALNVPEGFGELTSNFILRFVTDYTVDRDDLSRSAYRQALVLTFEKLLGGMELQSELLKNIDVIARAIEAAA